MTKLTVNVTIALPVQFSLLF